MGTPSAIRLTFSKCIQRRVTVRTEEIPNSPLTNWDSLSIFSRLDKSQLITLKQGIHRVYVQSHTIGLSVLVRHSRRRERRDLARVALPQSSPQDHSR